MYDHDVIVWADVETTGLRPEDGHQLLEIACLVTDTKLNILDDDGYEVRIRHKLDDVMPLADDYVREMHTTSGLWTKIARGDGSGTYEQVDWALTNYIKQFAPEPRQARLAGNSVRLDANFIDAFLPTTSAHLHYRILDISSIAYEAQIFWGIPYLPKEMRHEAMSDIRESIEELRYLREQTKIRASAARRSDLEQLYIELAG